MSRRLWPRVADRTTPAGEIPARPNDSAVLESARKRRHWRWRWLAATLVLAFIVATMRLFIWPDQGMPAQVSAIVMLDGPGNRLTTAIDLAYQHRPPFLVVSRGSPTYGHGSDCAPVIPRVQVICFDPNPSTTKGEAEFAGRLAKKYHWHSVALVTITPQDSRGRLRVERCLTGPVYVVTAPPSWWTWPYEIAYEWAAMVKAYVFQRSC